MKGIYFKEISSAAYEKTPVIKGYTEKILHADVSEGKFEIKSLKDKDIFTGGKGVCLQLLWDAVNNGTKWDSPENRICIACGPLGGIPNIPGSGKSIVASISPNTGSFMDSNVGGSFGALLKFAGFDAMEISGRSKREKIIVIDSFRSTLHVFEGCGLPEDSYALSSFLTHYFCEGRFSGVSVISTGPGAKNTRIGCLNFSFYDSKRNCVRNKQAGRGGLGTVFAAKGIKAVIVRADWNAVTAEGNNPADLKRLKKFAGTHSREIVALDPHQNDMRTLGTTHLTEIMNEFELLPVNNFRYGSYSIAGRIGAEAFRKYFDKGYDGCCKGCVMACAHCAKEFTPKTGPYKGQKVVVDGPEYETVAACGSNLGIYDPEFILEMNFYCDAYGIDTISAGVCIGFIMECYQEGIVPEVMEGLDFRNKEAALELLHGMAKGEGLGYIVGLGIRGMKEIFSKYYGADRKKMDDIGMEAKGLEFSMYITRESLAQQGGYGMALKGPHHDEAWLIFLDMVLKRMPTFEQKAEALYWFPLWRTWFSLAGLCKLPWNDVTPLDNEKRVEPAKCMAHVEWYAEYFSAVTGTEVKPDDLIYMSEKVYTLQRLFCLRMGFGTREFDNIPYRAMGPVSEGEYNSREKYYDGVLKEECGLDPFFMKMGERLAVLRKHREEQYELLLDAVYKRRGWTKEGIPSLATVKSLGLDSEEILKLLDDHKVWN